jgi:spermidine/putrescine transport system substrate-binding protein
MDFKTLLDNAQNRRSLLKGMGVAAVGLTFTGALAGCGEKEAKKLANGEEGKLNFYNWDTYIGETTLGRFQGRERRRCQYDAVCQQRRAVRQA